MGVVWLALDRQLEREVALKFLPEVVAYNEGALADLKRETRRALELTHPHIVRVYDLVADAENAAISMEYIDGKTLLAKRALTDKGVFEVADIREWVQQLCEALEYAHSKAKVVHRDLKPQNLMVNSKGDLKITDFGISRSLEESVSKTTHGGGGFSGTLSYMSPQQLDSKPTEPADDVYALGATIYELLTGKPPFYGGNLDRLIREAVPPSMVERRKELRIEGGADIPEAWEKTVAACLGKEPGQRPTDAKAVWEGLMASHQATKDAKEEKPESEGGRHRSTEKGADGETVGEGGAGAKTAERPQSSGGKGKWLALAAMVVVVGLGAWRLGLGRKGADSSTTPKGMSNLVASPPVQAARAATGQVAQVPAKPDEARVRREADPKAKPAPVRPAGQSFTNSLGMVFVPVPGTEVLFSIWETRVKDYAAYAAANSDVDESWKSPGFTQGDTHPVVNVSWNDSVAFCRWLTDTERKAGRLKADQEYRLPTDTEWSYAVGIGDRETGSNPKEKDGRLKDVYPWGTSWPPPSGAGNYADATFSGENLLNRSISGYSDGYAAASPVGSFKANAYGLFDMGGNAQEWCQDYYDGQSGNRVLRGAAWSVSDARYLLSSYRFYYIPSDRYLNYSFRVVLAGGGSSPAPGQVDRTPARPEPEQKPAEGLKSLGDKVATVMTNTIDMELVWIAPGKFTMGSPATEAGRYGSEGPQTEVTLTKGYWLGKYEVTQAEYEAVMGSNPSSFKGASLPVPMVSWNDAVEFCRKVTERERSAGKLPAGYEYRLPTEAQWEYACRAGTKTRFSGGDSDSHLGDAGWYSGNSGNETHPVGQKQPNAWGLYDMHGNVWEWCSDWSGEHPGGSVVDPVGASSGSNRVIRGGGWDDGAGGCRSARRIWGDPGGRNAALGFRAVLVSALEGGQPAQAETPANLEEKKAAMVPQARQPFENGLGMKFVPVPGTQVLFSIWETRVKDFAAFARDSANNGGWNYRSGSEPFVLKRDGWKQRGWEYGWDKPGFEQTPEHPVTCVSWDDAVAFCRWLTETERKAGRLKADQEYRLPTDAEWSTAVGSATYPWGNPWPPPSGAGNYGGEEAKDRDWPSIYAVLSGYRDGYARTAPAAQFDKNRYGLFDMGGNVWEWCQDWYRKELNTEEVRKQYSVLDNDGGGQKYHVLRGGSWDVVESMFLASSHHNGGKPDGRNGNGGFRCVVAVPGSVR
jgi:formylglycine-generating enzyme required for sulfatase activity